MQIKIAPLFETRRQIQTDESSSVVGRQQQASGNTHEALDMKRSANGAIEGSINSAINPTRDMHRSTLH